MGTLRGDNGGERPPEGGVPGLPPEWGTIVIPDDPSELTAEIRAVRRELRGQLRRARWRRRLGLRTRPTRHHGEDAAALGVPVLIMAIAILATLTSLFAVAWPRQTRAVPPPSSTAAARRIDPARIGLTDPAGGGDVPLAGELPAVVLLVDGCDCSGLVAQTVAAVPPGTHVLVVSGAAPPAGTPAPPAPARALVDGSGALRAALGPQPATRNGAAAALLVKSDGTVVRAIPAVAGVDEFRGDLALLRR